jgi:hypothetical protein
MIKSNSKTLEGLTNSNDTDKISTTIQDIVEKLKKENEMLEDTLLIDKHRADYEDMFLALEDYCNLALLQMLSIFANKPSLESQSSKTMLEGINEVNTLKTTLNDVMEYMDRKQSSGSSTTEPKGKTMSSFFN